MKKRIVSIILVSVMLISLLLTAAFAVTTEEQLYADIGGVYYPKDEGESKLLGVSMEDGHLTALIDHTPYTYMETEWGDSSSGGFSRLCKI